MVFLHKIGFNKSETPVDALAENGKLLTDNLNQEMLSHLKNDQKILDLGGYPFAAFAEKIHQIVFERLSYLIDGRICEQPPYGQQ